MVAKPKPPDEPAHDVLAAEEFGVPAPDPRLHQEVPHDVLAAEEFGVPAPDPALHHGSIALPGDPTGIAEPHDVLAAEEFAMPAPRDVPPRDAGRDPERSRAVIVAAAAVAWLVLRRRVRLRRRG